MTIGTNLTSPLILTVKHREKSIVQLYSVDPPITKPPCEAGVERC
jgi:hypothetical protein